jgi:hypothetical protein
VEPFASSFLAACKRAFTVSGECLRKRPPASAHYVRVAMVLQNRIVSKTIKKVALFQKI